ncbi:Rav1p ASCRUDRAFT_35547 [Ascoidea rubescens DSM 1968]|uniref:RAVE complex protein Rav1 C-terminal domain-containing protein n=1 Tax=Ascoidea rubescens DSM 1968 TaxID=1344418 RepID=A0A1D2VGW0_9ASCO|nr:hypothetical protein ASCRUDRAFT_35547 [Ascoidea rubescens DSM 1968]ODV60832.1 hypothetical protein ASCRUDRAFT_35547 [Ascoidea rubescens DSM 1968]
MSFSSNLTFAPGEPNSDLQAILQKKWSIHLITLYSSGNNLIILLTDTSNNNGTIDHSTAFNNNGTILQTVYFDSDIVSLDLNPFNGLIAVSTSVNKVFFLKPIETFMIVPKWHDNKLLIHKTNTVINTLAWGNSNEIVLGTNNSIILFYLVENFGLYSDFKQIYKLAQPNKINSIKFNLNSNIIITYSNYDYFLKIYNRLNFDHKNTSFNLTYLSHSSYITDFRFKDNFIRPASQNKNANDSLTKNSADNDNNTNKSEVVYTLTNNNILRIFTTFELEKNQIFKLVAYLDLNNNFPSSILSPSIIRYKLENKPTLILENIINLNLDLLIISDKSGNLTLYLIENLNSIPQKLIKFIPLKSLNFLNNPLTFCPLTFPKDPNFGNKAKNGLFDNHKPLRINTSSALLSNHKRYPVRYLKTSLQNKLTGHQKSIQSLFKSNNGEAMLSTSRFNENHVWIPIIVNDHNINDLKQTKNKRNNANRKKFKKTNGKVILLRKTMLITENPILNAILLRDGDFIITYLGNHSLALYQCKGKKFSNSLFNLPIKFEKKILNTKNHNDLNSFCFVHIPEVYSDFTSDIHYLIAVYPLVKLSKAWKIDLKNNNISEIAINSLPQDYEDEDIKSYSSIDPVGWSGKSNKVYKNNIFTTISSTGLLKSYYADVDKGSNKIYWKISYKIETGIKNASLIKESSVNKIAIVDSSTNVLTIWDNKNCILEYSEQFPQNEKIFDVDWTCNWKKQSILSIGFAQKVILYSQIRYDYTNNMPSFTSIKIISLPNLTSHIIGDSLWLKDGTLVIGCGNQLFVSSKYLDIENDIYTKKVMANRISDNIETIFDICSLLNGPLPLYHPQLIIQCLYMGKIDLVKKILLNLFNRLRKLDLNPEFTINNLGTTLGIPILSFYDKNCAEYDEELTTETYREYSDTVSSLLKEKLTLISLPYLTRHQQITLLSVIESLTEIEKNRYSLDENALKYYMGLKLLESHKSLQFKLNMRDILFALHSENKEILINMINNKNNFKINWALCKKYGFHYWVNNTQLKRQFEIIARNEFASSIKSDGKKDPENCTLFYLSLKKKNILIGLWKTCYGNPEQLKTIKLLNNNFNDPKWKKVAIKNAFALLSKHRYYYAACFFLLGDSLKDCVSVLIKQVKDAELAIAVTRVYDGDTSDVLRKVLNNHLLVDAILNGDRWTTSWVYWMLRENQIAIQALIKAPYNLFLFSNEKTGGKKPFLTESMSYLVDDPVLMILYNNLRQNNIEYFQGSLLVPIEVEFEFVLKIANIYSRMGCDYLVLDLLSNWFFFPLTISKNTEKKDMNESLATITSQSTFVEKDLSLNKFKKFNFNDFSPAKPVSNYGYANEAQSIFDSFF